MDKRILTDQDIEKYLDVQKNKLANLYNQAAVNTIMASMRNDIDAYISDHPDCMIEDLDHFIQLSDIYSYWVAHTTPTDVLKKIDHRKISKKSAWGVITISSLIAQETPSDIFNRAGRNAPALLPASLPSGYCTICCFIKYAPEK